ncbi:MAG: DNA alkylation repair protein [Defluviitaleaceae bacterium]|nr:DNA alkylation repair protein [Defluviitaleaceae bacterium]
MTAQEVMRELEGLASERTKKQYMGRGAKEPLFGVATGAMKPLFKRIGINHVLAEELYATGNYDVMYFAGMIADPDTMTPADFDRWMKAAYFPMLSDYVVAVTLSEASCAMDVADSWLEHGEELYRSAG